MEDFLDEVTASYEKLYKENAELKTNAEELHNDVGQYKSIETIVIDDVTSFKVKYKTMSISNNEEWEFEILN